MTDDSPSVVVIVRYIGGPTTIIEIAGVRFITDPTFDDAGRDYPLGPVVTLSKTMGPGVALADVGRPRCCAGQPPAASRQSG